MVEKQPGGSGPCRPSNASCWTSRALLICAGALIQTSASSTPSAPSSAAAYAANKAVMAGCLWHGLVATRTCLSNAFS